MPSAGSGDFPALRVDIAFGVGVATAPAGGDWVEVYSDVRELGIASASRNNELDLFEGGSITAVLANLSRQYDPKNASGAHFGDLVPRVQMRVIATWLGVDYPIGYGYVDGWPQSFPEEMRDGEVVVTAGDGFKILERIPLKSVWQYAVEALNPDRWYRLGEEAGTIMGDASGNGVHGIYEAGATFNHRGSIVPYAAGGAIEFDGADQVGRAAPLDGNADFSFCVWVKMPDEIPTGTPPAAPVYVMLRNDAGASKTHAAWSVWVDPDVGLGGSDASSLVFLVKAVIGNPRWSDAPVRAGRVYFVAGTYESGATSASLFVNGVEQTNDDSGRADTTFKNGLRLAAEASAGGIFDPFPGALGEFVAWDGIELTPTNIADLYEAGAAPLDGQTSGQRVGSALDLGGWPASMRDIDTGTSTFGPADLEGSLLDYLKLCAVSEAALFYMGPDGDVVFVGRANQKTEARFTTSAGTFSDRNGSLLYTGITPGGYDETSIVNVGRASRQGGIVQEYRDAASVAQYGERAFDDGNLLVGTDGECLDRATWRVLANAQPRFRVLSVTFDPRAHTALWPHVLGRQVGDRVTIEQTPLGSGSAITEDCYIAGITHTVTELDGAGAGKWETTWQLVPVDPNEDLWAVVGAGAARNRVGTAKVSY